MSFVVEPWNLLIVHPLINALVLLYNLVLHDFGWAIVILTVALRLVLYPLFVTQIRSQRAMQDIQPALAELKKRYKDDRQRFAEEQMKLYRERGVNPASGCLPVFLQMPILFGLYSALQQVGCGLGPPPGPDCPGLTHEQFELIRYPFVVNPVPIDGALDTIAAWLPWITGGLAHPEPSAMIDLFGNAIAVPLKILAVFAGLSQLVASLMTLPPKAPQTDDPMQRSMQGMVYYFPLFTVFIAWSLPAGLSLYWVVTTLFSIGQQWYVSGWGKLATLPVVGPIVEKIPAPARHAPKPLAVNPPAPAAQQQRAEEPRRRRRRR